MFKLEFPLVNFLKIEIQYLKWEKYFRLMFMDVFMQLHVWDFLCVCVIWEYIKHMNWLLNFCDHMCLECAIDKYDKVMHEYMNRVATYDYFRFASQVELEQEK